MSRSWPQIRGLSYSTIGRSIRGTVHSSDGADSHVRFDPPTSWRIESPDGTPIYIENQSDEYRVGDNGVAVHTSKSPNRLVSTFGLAPTLLLTAHRLWPIPGPMAHPQVGDPGEPTEVEVRGRSGWQIEFDDLHGGLPIIVVIDAQTGVALSWHQGERWMELSEPAIDEDFDPALFTWDGPTIETEEQLESQAQLEHEQKMRDIAAMPPTTFGWLPTEVHSSAVDGDPLSGALETTAMVGSIQFGVRRWLTEVGEPAVSFSLEHYPPVARRDIGPWTVELRAFGEIADEAVEPILGTLTLPDPPGSPDDIRDAVLSSQSAAADAEIAEQLGTGRELDDHLHGNGGASLLIRTDFSDDTLWRAVVIEATAPYDDGYGNEFSANLTCIDNSVNDGLTVDELLARMGDDPPFYAFIADTETLTNPEHPILAINNGRAEWGDERGQTIRIIPPEMWGIENNLSISNMDFRAFADSADADGVFRGFPPPPRTVATLNQEDLIALSRTNTSTDALARFARDIVDLPHAHATVHESDLARTNRHVATSDYSGVGTVMGRDDYLAATRDGGIGHETHVTIDRGYWSLLIDPDSDDLAAAMLVQMPVPPTD